MAASKSVTVSRVIPAPSERVWEVLDDTSRYAEWVPQTVEVTRNDGEAVVGGTYDGRHEGEGLPLVKNLSIEFRTEAAGESTEVTSTLRYDPTLGPLGGLIDKLAHGQTVAAQEQALANLEELVRSEVAQATA